MADNFSTLKKTRDAALDKLTKEAQKNTSGKSQTPKDDRFWQPTVDKFGAGYAVIRFLPAPQGEDVPWVRYWDHGFQGPGGWYIENSLTTIGLPDPVSELNSKLWNASSDDNSPERKQARAQKRRLHYVANVKVIKDPANPENEGQVKLFRFGKKIFDKINAKMNPAEEFGDEPINPFDPWEGCNFRIKIKNVSGYRNYDESEFDRQSAVAPTDAEIEALWKTEYSLQQFIAPDQFKPRAELEKTLARVLGNTSEASARKEENEVVDAFLGTAEASVGKTAGKPDLSYFQKLAESDDEE